MLEIKRCYPLKNKQSVTSNNVRDKCPSPFRLPPARLNFLLSRDSDWDLREIPMAPCSLNLAATLLWIPNLQKRPRKQPHPWPERVMLSSSVHLRMSTTFSQDGKSFHSVLYVSGSSTKDLWTWWESAFLPHPSFSWSHKSFRYLNDISLNSGYFSWLSPTMWLPQTRCWLYKQNSSWWTLEPKAKSG